MRELIVLAFILPFAVSIKAQSYIPLPDSNAVWTETQSSVTKFAVKGDSIYNTLTYKKYYMVSDTNLSAATYTYFAMVRQDLANKKVFGIKNATTTERLLYDFNLNINDSIRVYNLFSFNGAFFNGYKLKLIAKDSILINGIYHKRLKLSNWGGIIQGVGYDYWVEGMGSIVFGIFNSGTSGFTYTDACIPSLLCQKQNGVLNYLNPTYNSCFAVKCTVGVNEINNKNAFKLYPNPFTNQLTLNTNSNELKKLIITNLLGQTVYQTEFYQNSKTIDLPQLPSGAYLATLYVNNVVGNRSKLIKE